jgi:phage terminase small subunit
MKGLNPRQEQFAHEYLIDLNATQAAIRSGYSAHTAAQIGERLLRKVEIQQLIQHGVQERSQRTQVSADRVITELARIAFFDPRNLYAPDGSLRAVHDLDEDTARVLTSLEIQNAEGAQRTRMRWADKLAALEQLGRHLGLFQQKYQLDLNMKARVVIVPAKAAPLDQVPQT